MAADVAVDASAAAAAGAAVDVVADVDSADVVAGDVLLMDLGLYVRRGMGSLLASLGTLNIQVQEMLSALVSQTVQLTRQGH